MYANRQARQHALNPLVKQRRRRTRQPTLKELAQKLIELLPEEDRPGAREILEEHGVL